MNGIKKYVKRIFPSWVQSCIKIPYSFLKRIRVRRSFKQMYWLDLKRYLLFSRTLGNDTSEKMIGSICLQYHVIEKGLTMPDTRVGFGRLRIIALCQACITYIENYGYSEEQVNHAIGVIFEYEKFHSSIDYQLDNDVVSAINKLRNKLNNEIKSTHQLTSNKESYFRFTKSSFPGFSASRSSIRNFSKTDLSIDKIISSLKLACKTPSACNRQPWRTNVYSDKILIAKLLEEQGGSNGFSHLANKLIIISGELAGFCFSNERYQVYIDCGMYAMNLLYALHYNQVAACILNCSFDYEKELEVKRIAGIKDSEVLIAMIACGEATDDFKIALSHRYGIEKTNTFRE
jgi:nitroreductase